MYLIFFGLVAGNMVSNMISLNISIANDHSTIYQSDRQTLTILVAVSLFTACLPSDGSILYQLTLGNWVVACVSEDQ